MTEHNITLEDDIKNPWEGSSLCWMLRFGNLESIGGKELKYVQAWSQKSINQQVKTDIKKINWKAMMGWVSPIPLSFCVRKTNPI
jgi:hypothetical protein